MIIPLEDEQCEELEKEFSPFQVWIDIRPRDDGHLHWHARLPNWTSLQIISASDADSMRAKLTAYRQQNPAEEQS